MFFDKFLYDEALVLAVHVIVIVLSSFRGTFACWNGRNILSIYDNQAAGENTVLATIANTGNYIIISNIRSMGVFPC